MNVAPRPSRALLGLHLMPSLDLVGTPRPSVLAQVSGDGRAVRLELLDTDEAIVAALPPGPALLVVDAPLHVPNARGQRPIEEILAWCDIPVLPVGVERFTRLYGGLRGVALRPGLGGDGRELWETAPDAVLRQIAWEEAGVGSLPLEEYRAAWLGIRPPRYRPSLTGRARPEGIQAAHRLISGALDLDWSPSGADDWGHVADAARLDALACALAALRMWRGASSEIDAGGAGRLTLPADANLAGRLAIHAARLQAAGRTVEIVC